MHSKTLSESALSLISEYSDFKVGTASCSVPYFNNKTAKIRAALGVFVGKGSPREILDEALILIRKNHIAPEAVTDEILKKLLTDSNIGIDCSGFAYHVLNSESLFRYKISLEKKIHFTQVRNFAGKLLASLHPAKNIDVATMADNKNSRVVSVSEAKPGDFISMMEGPDGADRNHILIIHKIDYSNDVPQTFYYSHAAAYPEDGLYGTGIKQGRIIISDPDKNIVEASWDESGQEGEKNRLFIRARKSKTELRRFNWFE